MCQYEEDLREKIIFSFRFMDLSIRSVEFYCGMHSCGIGKAADSFDDSCRQETDCANTHYHVMLRWGCMFMYCVGVVNDLYGDGEQ